MVRQNDEDDLPEEHFVVSKSINNQKWSIKLWTRYCFLFSYPSWNIGLPFTVQLLVTLSTAIYYTPACFLILDGMRNQWPLPDLAREA